MRAPDSSAEYLLCIGQSLLLFLQTLKRKELRGTQRRQGDSRGERSACSSQLKFWLLRGFSTFWKMDAVSLTDSGEKLLGCHQHQGPKSQMGKLEMNVWNPWHKITFGATLMFMAALFTVAKTWKQPRGPWTDEWIKKIWYIYTVEYYSAIKKNGIMPFAATWMDL